MQAGTRGTVLIVEDEYLIAFDLAEAAREAGWTVAGPAGDLREALLRVRADATLGLAILDINLTDGKVYPIAHALADRGTPFVFMTGQNGEVVPSRFCSVPVCLKPMRASAILQEALKTVPAGSRPAV